jgi:hypothetical protein
MDEGLAIGPIVGVAAASGYARPTAGATDLPDVAAINPARDASLTRNDTGRPDNSAASYTARSTTIDPGTREVIYRVIDTRTRQVLQQTPDEALLRRQAYSKAIENGSTPFDAQARADLEA